MIKLITSSILITSSLISLEIESIGDKNTHFSISKEGRVILNPIKTTAPLETIKNIEILKPIKVTKILDIHTSNIKSLEPIR